MSNDTPAPEEAPFSPQPDHQPAQYVLEDQVREDVTHLAICLIHDSGLTDTEMAWLDGEGEERCVFALRLDDLDAAGVALVSVATVMQVEALKGRLHDADAQYQQVIEDLRSLGEVLGHPQPDAPPREFFRQCITEVKALLGK
jgi:hypothetical protein